VIVSDKHKYVFIEIPKTGSTAIAKELVEKYDGKSILKKHSFYHEFLKKANDEERKYFAFSCVRNPLDDAVSVYFKLKSNHRGDYTNPEKLAENGGWVTKRRLAKFTYIHDHDASFSEFFLVFYKLPYDDMNCVSGHQMNYIMRFESLSSDFMNVLHRLGIEPVRDLPVVNKTAERGLDYLNYYQEPAVRKRSAFIFGPFMKKWGYELPRDWSDVTVSLGATLLFRGLAICRRGYWKLIKRKR
jgi:hypothetical protein